MALTFSQIYACAACGFGTKVKEWINYEFETNMLHIPVALFLGTQAAYAPFPSKAYQVVEYSE